MKRLALDQDIQPLSEFRSNAASFIQQVRETGRPLVITQHGKSAAVLIDVREYEAILSKLDLLLDVRTAESQLDKGEGLPHEQVKSELLAEIRQNA